MKYICLSKEIYEYNDYSVLTLREEDIMLIKDWRNQQMDILRQTIVLTEQDQSNYFSQVVKKTFSEKNPKIILVSFMKNNICIGYGGLTNIDWTSKRAEISFLVNTNRVSDEVQYRDDFSAFLSLMKIIAFQDLGFNRLFTETYDIRPLHISILQGNGFKLEGRMKEHILIKSNFIDSLIHGYLKQYYEVEG